jgi:hypothetical protein
MSKLAEKRQSPRDEQLKHEVIESDHPLRQIGHENESLLRKAGHSCPAAWGTNS